MSLSPRRELAPEDLAAVLRALAAGVPLPQCARQYHVTAQTLRTQLQRAAWQAWCAALGLSGVPWPGGP